MSTFIEDYLQNPTLAILNAKTVVENKVWHRDLDDELIYAQIDSPEFRLYEEVILSSRYDDNSLERSYA